MAKDFVSVAFHEAGGEIRRLELPCRSEDEARSIAEAQLLGGALVAKVRRPSGVEDRVRLEAAETLVSQL